VLTEIDMSLPRKWGSALISLDEYSLTKPDSNSIKELVRRDTKRFFQLLRRRIFILHGGLLIADVIKKMTYNKNYFSAASEMG
jgi:hypothetical protein